MGAERALDRDLACLENCDWRKWRKHGSRSDYRRLGDLGFIQGIGEIPIHFIVQNDTQILSISNVLFYPNKNGR